MEPVHFSHFISCEDHLAKPSLFGVVGVHNAACAVTGVVLMAMPYRAVLSARRHFTSASLQWKNKHDMGTSLKPEVVAYLAALTFLFYTNLHQHFFGTVYWDLDVGGGLHTIFLSLMVYEYCKETLHDKLRVPRLHSVITRSLASVAAVVELATPLFADSSLGRQVAVTVGSMVALTVVPFMGYLSWIQRHADQSRAFLLWMLAVVGVKAAESLVQLEKTLCTKNKLADWILRLFHPIVIHSVIWLLFWAVSECAFSVMKQNSIASTGDKKIMKKQ